MQIGELFLDDGVVFSEPLGEPGNEEKSKMITEEVIVFPDSQPFAFFYHEDRFFSSNVISANKIVQLADSWSFDALLFVDRACRHLIVSGCDVQFGDVMGVDSLHTMRYMCRLRAVQFHARDTSIVASFGQELQANVLSLTGGVFYKNGQSEHGYTDPDANLELWMHSVCKEMDWMLGSVKGRARRKLDAISLDMSARPLTLRPEYIFPPPGFSLTKALKEDIEEYISSNASSHHTLEGEDRYERTLSMGYKTVISVSRTADSRFSCVIEVEHRRRAEPFYMEFSIEGEHFVFLCKDQSSIMERVQWLQGLFLSAVRAWTHPAQLIAYGVRANKKRDVMKLTRRYVQVEKEFVVCKICEDRPINWAYTSCGHCLCSECAAKLQKQCPICKAKVTGNLKLFI